MKKNNKTMVELFQQFFEQIVLVDDTVKGLQRFS